MGRPGPAGGEINNKLPQGSLEWAEGGKRSPSAGLKVGFWISTLPHADASRGLTHHSSAASGAGGELFALSFTRWRAMSKRTENGAHGQQSTFTSSSHLVMWECRGYHSIGWAQQTSSSLYPSFSQQRGCLPIKLRKLYLFISPHAAYLSTHSFFFFFFSSLLKVWVAFSWYHWPRNEQIAIDSLSQQAFADLLSRVGVVSLKIKKTASRPLRSREKGQQKPRMSTQLEALWWMCAPLLWEHRGGTQLSLGVYGRLPRIDAIWPVSWRKEKSGSEKEKWGGYSSKGHSKSKGPGVRNCVAAMTSD